MMMTKNENIIIMEPSVWAISVDDQDGSCSDHVVEACSACTNIFHQQGQLPTPIVYVFIAWAVFRRLLRNES